MPIVTTNSVEETIALGERVGALVEAGHFIALTGELGSGKTHFVRGMAAGMGVDPAIRVTSPTYTLLNMYQGRLPLYHFDLYRLTGNQEIVDLGFEEYFYGNGVCVVEWAEYLGDLLPAERMSIVFTYLDDNARQIVFEPFGDQYAQVMHALAVSDL